MLGLPQFSLLLHPRGPAVSYVGQVRCKSVETSSKVFRFNLLKNSIYFSAHQMRDGNRHIYILYIYLLYMYECVNCMCILEAAAGARLFALD